MIALRAVAATKLDEAGALAAVVELFRLRRHRCRLSRCLTPALSRAVLSTWPRLPFGCRARCGCSGSSVGARVLVIDDSSIRAAPPPFGATMWSGEVQRCGGRAQKTQGTGAGCCADESGLPAWRHEGAANVLARELIQLESEAPPIVLEDDLIRDYGADRDTDPAQALLGILECVLEMRQRRLYVVCLDLRRADVGKESYDLRAIDPDSNVCSRRPKVSVRAACFDEGPPRRTSDVEDPGERDHDSDGRETSMAHRHLAIHGAQLHGKSANPCNQPA